MRILLTGCQGKVGSVTAAHLKAAGHDVVGVDLPRAVYDAPLPGGGGFPDTYIQADLEDAGAVFALVARFKPDAVVHVAAIPDPTHNVPHHVFRNNIMSTFNIVEATQKLGVPRLVNISSEHVPGFFTSPGSDPWGSTRASGAGLPRFAPVDETHPVAPQNPYALSKAFGEQLCDAAVLRAGPALTVLSIRPSWCQDRRNAERNLGPLVRDHTLSNDGLWSYICIPDLADAIVLAATKPLPALAGRHEVLYIAAEDNIGGRDFKEAMLAHFPSIALREELPRRDCSGLNCGKARELLGWSPKLTWRDYLDEAGALIP
jgi:UDP-glucose 4-epimerase